MALRKRDKRRKRKRQRTLTIGEQQRRELEMRQEKVGLTVYKPRTLGPSTFDVQAWDRMHREAEHATLMKLGKDADGSPTG